MLSPLLPEKKKVITLIFEIAIWFGTISTSPKDFIYKDMSKYIDI